MGFLNFGVISLRNYEESSDIGTGRAVSSNTPLQGGGSIDDFGSGQTFTGEKRRSYKGIVAKQTQEELELYINQIKRQKGARGKLSLSDANGEIKFIFARLTEVKEINTTKENRNSVNKVQSINLNFVCDSDTWFGDIIGPWQLNDGNLINDNLTLNDGVVVDLSSSPVDEEVVIAQDSIESKINARGPKFTFTVPAGGSLSSMRIDISSEGFFGSTLLFTGTVAAETELIIDCSNSTVLNDGVDAYDDLAITPSLDSPSTWSALFVGTNTLRFTHNGTGDITCLIEYAEEHI